MKVQYGRKKLFFSFPGIPGSRRRVRLGDPGTPKSYNVSESFTT